MKLKVIFTFITGAALAVSARNVSATPAPALAAELGAPDSVIRGPELRSYGNTFYEVEEALAAREGITFLAAGDVGAEDWILVRGLPRDSSRNVLVLLDGAPINNAAYEGVEVHDLPSTHLDRVEIFRPPLPARFGGYHAVIAFYSKSLRTKDGTDVRGSAAIGSLATSRTSAAIASRAGAFTVDASFATLDTAGLSGRFRTMPFENLRYEDRSYRDWAPTARIAYRPDDRTLVTFFATGSKSVKAFSDDELRNRWFALAGAMFARKLGDHVLLRGGVHGGYERYFLRLRMHPDVSLQLRRRLGGRVELVLAPATTSTIVLGAEADDRSVTTADTAVRLLTSAAFVEGRLQPVRALELFGGLRADRYLVDHREFGHDHGGRDDLGWSFGAAAHVTSRATLSARFGKSNRWPALGELSGHDALRNEHLLGGELRARVRIADVTLGAAIYSLRLRDEIGLGGHGSDVNLPGQSHARGVEGRIEAPLTSFASAYATFTWSRVTTERGEPVGYGPPALLASSGLLVHGEKTAARVSFRYLGSKEGVLRHHGEVGRIEDALLLDAWLEQTVAPHVRAWAQGGNLLGLTYETFQGRPMIPRTVLLGISVDHGF